MQAAPDSAAVEEALPGPLRHNFQQYKVLAYSNLSQISSGEWLCQPAPGRNPAVITELRADDSPRTVLIRNQAHAVLRAVQRQVAYHASHSGQLVQLARITRGDNFYSLSTPRGQGQQFNQATTGAR